MPKRHYRPFDAIASTIHLDKLCFKAARPLVCPPNEIKKLLQAPERGGACSVNPQCPDQAEEINGRPDKEKTCTLKRVPITLGT